MCALQRIANFHLRRRAFAREGMIVARRVAQRDAEIVDAVERARYRRPRAGVTVTVMALLAELAPPRRPAVRPGRLADSASAPAR